MLDQISFFFFFLGKTKVRQDDVSFFIKVFSSTDSLEHALFFLRYFRHTLLFHSPLSRSSLSLCLSLTRVSYSLFHSNNAVIHISHTFPIHELAINLNLYQQLERSLGKHKFRLILLMVMVFSSSNRLLLFPQCVHCPPFSPIRFPLVALPRIPFATSSTAILYNQDNKYCRKIICYIRPKQKSTSLTLRKIARPHADVTLIKSL